MQPADIFAKSVEAAELASALSRESSSATKKRNLREAIATLDEDNLRLRKKLDLIKYQVDERTNKLLGLRKEYEELVNGKPPKMGTTRASSSQDKKKITRLENQLHRVSVMQMEADTVRKKYRSVRANLKADASYYASCLDALEDGIREQDNETNRLQSVKAEAIELRDTTKESLARQEIEAMRTTKERESVVQEYRRRVEERKAELERLERMMFSNARVAPRNEFASGCDKAEEEPGDQVKDPRRAELDRLEESIVKLRNATGVSRTEDVLSRFLAQTATRDKLKKMRATAEEVKIQLEKRRQQLTAEIEMQKFSETKDSDRNAEKVAKLSKRTQQQNDRQERAAEKISKCTDACDVIAEKLLAFCDKLGEDGTTSGSTQALGPTAILDKLDQRIKGFVARMGGGHKFHRFLEQISGDRIEATSLEAASESTKPINLENQPLFPLFPIVAAPPTQAQPSEDEDDIPSRSFLKRQAQLLVDTKSRRKGFALRR